MSDSAPIQKPERKTLAAEAATPHGTLQATEFGRRRAGKFPTWVPVILSTIATPFAYLYKRIRPQKSPSDNN